MDYTTEEWLLDAQYNGNLAGIQREIEKKALESSHLLFSRYFFKVRDGMKFIVNQHHDIMCETLDKVFSGEITRLIINIPPRYTKTELAVNFFVARGMAKNPRARFIHVSYSRDLAQVNSVTIKKIQESPEYQKYWPMACRKDSKAKGIWNTDKGGGLLATSSGGGITGFGAGLMEPGFSGAFIIDDPLKPDDAHSEVERSKVNKRATETFASRLAHEKVPIIVIMQRLHEDDYTGFLLKGGTGERWHHLLLPVEINSGRKYPEEYTHGIPVQHSLPDGPLWEYKHGMDKIENMRKTDPYTTASQLDQSPAPLGGGLFKEGWWMRYDIGTEPELFDYRFITVDTAQKTAEHNDYSVGACWGMKKDKLYLLDIIRGKWESPELKQNFKDFWAKHRGLDAARGKLHVMYVEDKASGTDLLQNLGKGDKPIPMIAIQRNKDKVIRAHDAVKYIASGQVYLPNGAPFIFDFIDEFKKFTPLFTHKHDDQVDVTLDAIEKSLHVAKKTSGAF